MLGKDCDREGLEVVFELPRDDEESHHQLFKPLVSGLGVGHGMTDVVHWLLGTLVLPNQGSSYTMR